LKILRGIIDEHMEDIKQAGGLDCLVEEPGEIAQDMLKTSSDGGAHQGIFYPTSSSYDKTVLGSRLPSRENSPHTDSFGRVSSRGHDTRDSYGNIRYENSRHQYQNASDHEKGGIRKYESAMDRGYSDHHENDTHKRNPNDESKYGHKYKKNISDYHSESSDRSTWSKQTPKSSEREYGGMSGNRSNDRTRSNHSRHRSMPVNKDQFSDRYDPQSRYSDEDPPTNMCYDVSDGKDELYHDEIHPPRERHTRRRDDKH
jgi:U11/U12 small nuclear ribonucleoprotein SNRNP48